MVESGTGGAAYYADVLEEIVRLAVEAPCGPPASTADFLGRLDASWLALAYAGAPGDGSAGLLRTSAGHVGDVALRYRALLRRLGSGLDGPGGFGDADAWYCILEGTAEIAVAEAQARTIVDLLTSYVARGAGRPRAVPAETGQGGAGQGGAGQHGASQDGASQDAPGAGREPSPEVLLAVDEFSAVSRRLPVWQLYERARSLGLAVQVSAQSWQGLADDEDDRGRIAASADGGIWLLRTPHPDPVVALAGNRKMIDTTRRLMGAPLWGDDGSSRVRQAPVLDPDIVRSLDVGQAAYVYRGGATFVQVKRLVAGPAALPPPVPRDAPGRPSAAAAAGQPDGAEPAAGPGEPAVPPDAGPLLDEAFGKESR
jgi:hypothetical protein